MRRYELLWILPGDASDEDCEASVSRTTSTIAASGGKLHSAELWGRRNLSYPINKHTEGAYYVAEFSADGDGVVRIGKQMTADQSVLRHMIVWAQKVETGKKDTSGSRDRGRGARR